MPRGTDPGALYAARNWGYTGLYDDGPNPSPNSFVGGFTMPGSWGALGGGGNLQGNTSRQVQLGLSLKFAIRAAAAPASA